MTFAPGDAVQTPLGKGVVRDVRNNGRLLVELKGRAVEVVSGSVTRLASDVAPTARAGRRRSGGVGAQADSSATPRARTASAEVDLHGLTVEDAMARVDDVLNDALLADLPGLRLVHGRSGGRIRAALHRRPREVSSVRAFRLDPRNPGVTIVSL